MKCALAVLLAALATAPATAHATLPGRNGKIAFAARAGGTVSIITVEPDGSGQTALTTDDPGLDLVPDWSPDGTRLTYTAGNAFTTVRPGRDGRGRESLGAPHRPSTQDSDDPDWSPDGGRIAFARSVIGSSYEIYTMRPDGSEVVQVTNNATDDFRPQWSPDGKKIAFLRQDTDSNLKLWVMNADGSDEHKVADLEIHNRIDWQPIPNRPPDCSTVRATPASLGAPNHRLITVTISGGTDPDGDQVDLEITGVTQDEPVTGPPDAVATTIPHRVRLRAERDPHGDGRVYRIALRGKRRPRRHLHRLRDRGRAQGQPGAGRLRAAELRLVRAVARHRIASTPCS